MEKYTVKVFSNKTVWYQNKWYQNNKLHRIDGPAIDHSDGTKEWYQNNKRHRIDGPAVEYPGGEKHWYQNGKRHRINGPAVEFADGSKEWYIKGIQYTEKQYNKKINSCNDKIVEIDGVKYRLVKD